MFILDMIRADKYNAEADRINVKALNKLGDVQRKQREKEERTKQALEKLANRKRGIIATSIKDFINVYEKIMMVQFNESDGIKQLENSNLSPVIIDEMKTMVSVAGYALTPNQTVATFLVGMLKLSGISNIIAKEAELNATVARIRKRQADVASSQAETIIVALEGIYQRAERMAKLLAQLNVLFRKSIETTRVIIEKNGQDRRNYSVNEKKYIQNCLNFADAIKKILDVPLFDETGEMTVKSIAAIETGEKYLKELNKITS